MMGVGSHQGGGGRGRVRDLAPGLARGRHPVRVSHVIFLYHSSFPSAQQH